MQSGLEEMLFCLFMEPVPVAKPLSNFSTQKYIGCFCSLESIMANSVKISMLIPLVI